MSTEATATPAVETLTTPQVTPQTPAKEPSKPATLEHFSDDQIEARVHENLDRILRGEKPKKEVEKKPEPKVEEPAEKAEENQPEKPVKKAKEEPKSEDVSEDEPQPRRRKRSEAPKEDDGKLEKAVEKLADKITKRQEPEKGQSLTKADVEKRRVFEQMAKDNPEEYAGLPEKFEKFVAQESKYRAKWEKENPGERYNPDDESHSEFYDNYGIEYDNDAYVDARVELAAEKRFENFTKRQQEQQERAQREREAEQQAERMTSDIPKLLAKEIVGKEVDLDALESEDPVAHNFITRAMGDANEMISELAKLSADPSKLDLKGNPTHGILLERLEYYETQLGELPFAKTVIKEGGRTKEFATLEDFQQMNAADKKHYWTVYTHPEQTKKYILKDFGNLVKGDIERHEKMFEQRLAKRNGGSSQSQTGKETPQPKPRRESPEITGGDRRVPPVETGDDKPESVADRIDNWLSVR